ncbi:MAG: P-II family nitrogen regulator [Lentisphaerales bacterium]|jgi:nitrogen regulatory protein P-II 1|nr:MAG: P-II family nitrogen regulator [Lentisphaerales bacterium]
MRQVTAYIHAFMTEKVTDALRMANIHGVTIITCEGFGRAGTDADKGHYLDSDVELGFAAKTKLEIVCRDEETVGIVDLIQRTARTGRHGDGKIFVSPVTHVVSIRTGEKGESVL